MQLIEWIKSLFCKRTHYKLPDVFGCSERPPQNCPTFLERDVHKSFQNAIYSHNIIVVYGESRQGKTWTIERYCPNQLRIGCNASMDIEQLKQAMLDSVGIEVLTIQHSVTEEYAEGCTASTATGSEMLLSAGVDATLSAAHKETLTTTYNTVDLSKNSNFLKKLKERAEGKYFVFDNFHYLHPSVQQEFCTLLKEFNYQEIKVIIVGVWKDSSRITALAPDLLNRCSHIDIGSWSEDELQTVLDRGSRALNIKISSESATSFIKYSAHNIGIFKAFLQRYCQAFSVDQTLPHLKLLADSKITEKVTEDIISEMYIPLHDRIVNLSMPQRERKDSKKMRLKIVIAVLKYIIDDADANTQTGIPFNAIKNGIDSICNDLGDDLIGVGNLTQELGLLHTREENRQTKSNYIPLFYYDKANKKLLVIEPTVYVLKAYDKGLLEKILAELIKIANSPLETEQLALCDDVVSTVSYF